jgi:hypothetical protein
MDREIEQYSFSHTLKLEVSIYFVICCETPSLFFQTTCEWAMKYLKDVGTPLLHVTANTYIIKLESDFHQATLNLEDFWIATDNECKPIPV